MASLKIKLYTKRGATEPTSYVVYFLDVDGTTLKNNAWGLKLLNLVRKYGSYQPRLQGGAGRGWVIPLNLYPQFESDYKQFQLDYRAYKDQKKSQPPSMPNPTQMAPSKPRAVYAAGLHGPHAIYVPNKTHISQEKINTSQSN